MPVERLSMRKVREVLRLKHALGMSYRAISEATGIGKTAAAEYVHRAAVIGVTWPVPAAMGDAELERGLFPVVGSMSAPPRAVIDWPAVQVELKRRGVTLLLLWQEYRAEHPGGYGYSRYCDLYCAWKKQVSATMRQTHLAGDKLFVDWAGDTIGVADPATGEVHPARIFVAILSILAAVASVVGDSGGVAAEAACSLALCSRYAVRLRWICPTCSSTCSALPLTTSSTVTRPLSV